MECVAFTAAASSSAGTYILHIGQAANTLDIGQAANTLDTGQAANTLDTGQAVNTLFLS